jgi:uncharacterized membrane protein YqhA
MPRLLGATRYLVVIPVIGLAIAAAAFFVVGGVNLILLVVRALLVLVGLAEEVHHTEVPIEVEIVEYVHTFLIGTVLYITAIGLYQLFIEEIRIRGWLRIDSTEELETNLIGVTVVVLAVNFLGVVFTNDPVRLLQYGAGIALPILALAVFVGLRTWSTHLVKSDEKPNKKAEQPTVKSNETSES